MQGIDKAAKEAHEKAWMERREKRKGTGSTQQHVHTKHAVVDLGEGSRVVSSDANSATVPSQQNPFSFISKRISHEF
jgi:hypothetical protein